jgi:hypothetical protein
MTPSPETIAAYADGGLEGEALREVEAAVAADPALQAQVAAHRALKRRLGAHFAPIAEESVPDSLVRAVRGGGEVVDFADAARRRARPAASSPWRRYAGPALAASLVLGLIGVGLRQQQSSDYAHGEIAGALEGQLAETQSPQAPVRILLSFRDGAGAFCRGFSSAAQSGIACKDDRGWRLRKVVGGEEAAPGDYRQAGSADADVLAAIQDMARGEALDAQAERSAMQRGWRD